jgi:hypothetical protein
MRRPFRGPNQMGWIRCLGLLTCLAIPAASREPASVWKGVEKIVAVGDVHGDYDQLVTVLKSAGLIDEGENWTGGKTHLVQNGDVLDRGPDSRKAMDLLMKLDKQAEAAGGRVHALIGNHESMNVRGDFRYTSAAEYAAFSDQNSAAIRDAAYQKEGGGQDRAQWDDSHPLGFVEHRAAFSVTGRYGEWIAHNDAVIKINTTLFLHAGISAKFSSQKIDQINGHIRSALKDRDMPGDSILTDQEGPLWYRGLANGNEQELEPQLKKTLKNFGVDRIVIGHTYANAAITPRFDGRVIMVDIGLSRVYDGVGKVGCLVIEQDKPYVLHRGTRLELPTDSGKDLLRYLRLAAALDPPPSPLAKRIADLESRLGTP